MFWIADILWLLVAAIAYWAYGPVLSVMDAAPVFPVILLVRVALNEGSTPGNLFGFLAGALLDVFSLEWLGAAMLVDSIVGYGVGALRTHIVLDNALVRAGVLLGAALVHTLGLVLLKSIAYPPGPEPFISALIGGVYTALVGTVWWTFWGALRSVLGLGSLWQFQQ